MTDQVMLPFDKVFNIRGIYIRKNNARMGADFDPVIPYQHLIYFHRITNSGMCMTTYDIVKDDGTFQIKVCVFFSEIRFRYYKAKLENGVPIPNLTEDAYSEDEVAVELITEFVADYQLLVSELPSEVHLRAYANEVHQQIWPYYRENVHNMMTRMAMPAAHIPMYKQGEYSFEKP